MDIDKFIPGKNYHVRTSDGWQIAKCVKTDNSKGKAVFRFGYVGNDCYIDESKIDDACLVVSPGDPGAIKQVENKFVPGKYYLIEIEPCHWEICQLFPVGSKAADADYDIFRTCNGGVIYHFAKGTARSMNIHDGVKYPEVTKQVNDKFVPGEYYWLLTNDEGWRLTEYLGGDIFRKYYEAWNSVSNPGGCITNFTDSIHVERPNKEGKVISKTLEKLLLRLKEEMDTNPLITKEEKIIPRPDKVTEIECYQCSGTGRQFYAICPHCWGSGKTIMWNCGGSVIADEKPHKHHFEINLVRPLFWGEEDTPIMDCTKRGCDLRIVGKDKIAQFINQLIDNQKE